MFELKTSEYSGSLAFLCCFLLRSCTQHGFYRTQHAQRQSHRFSYLTERVLQAAMNRLALLSLLAVAAVLLVSASAESTLASRLAGKRLQKLHVSIFLCNVGMRVSFLFWHVKISWRCELLSLLCLYVRFFLSAVLASLRSAVYLLRLAINALFCHESNENHNTEYERRFHRKLTCFSRALLTSVLHAACCRSGFCRRVSRAHFILF